MTKADTARHMCKNAFDSLTIKVVTQILPIISKYFIEFLHAARFKWDLAYLHSHIVNLL
jgi:hypothetical protein